MIGNENAWVETTDRLDRARAEALCASLALDSGRFLGKGHLPPFWHYLYFWEARAPTELGRDGHPKTGGFIPDLGLPRRMWAGGALDFLHPLAFDEPAEKRSRIAEISRKSGRSGDLALVTVSHEIVQRGRICVHERQDLIYRAEADPAAPSPPPPSARRDETTARETGFDPTLLFRYSALTFNGHRIHYDRDYCRNVEGYPGLVVHGPLLAQLLIHLAMETRREIGHFRFRATSPLFDGQKAVLCAAPVSGGLDLWIRGPEGQQIMTAFAS